MILEGDIVLLTRKRDDGIKQILTRPLRAGDKIQLQKDDWTYADKLIGRNIQDFVISAARAKDKMKKYKILQPSLGEYVRFSPRIVTPASIWPRFESEQC